MPQSKPEFVMKHKRIKDANIDKMCLKPRRLLKCLESARSKENLDNKEITQHTTIIYGSA
jgi:hypothetical protein